MSVKAHIHGLSEFDNIKVDLYTEHFSQRY